MNPIDIEAARKAWQRASTDLDVRVVTRGFLNDADGGTYELVAIVPDFGGTHGMAVLPESDAALADLAASQGFGWTVLGKSYENYDRALFKETLNDWQWTGKGQPPAWYIG